jgi:hypothetical protein
VGSSERANKGFANPTSVQTLNGLGFEPDFAMNGSVVFFLQHEST